MAKFSQYFGCSLDRLDIEDVRTYQVQLVAGGISWPAVNFTDPESRILKTKDGYIQGYNAQAAVDGAHRIIVAQTLTNSASDQAQLAPLLDGIKANLGRNAGEVSAGSSCCAVLTK